VPRGVIIKSMSTTQRSESLGQRAQANRPVTRTVAALVAMNLVITCALLYFATTGGEDPIRPPEVWRSFVPWLGVQAAVNGTFLLLSRRTREVGLGMLVGVLGVAALACVWLLVVVLSNSR
jgi:hypothetical protein